MIRSTALAIGAIQLLANALMLVRGVSRLPQELARQGATARIGDLLTTSWVYGTLANVLIAVLLMLIARPLQQGDALAWRLGLAIGAYYVVLGLASFFLAPERHPGLLVFSLLGAALLGVLVVSRIK